MKLHILLLGLLFFVQITSCDGQGKPVKTQFLTYMKEYRGRVTEKIFCVAEQDYSYALYLPSYYDTTHNWPIIISFDSQGDGKLPLSLMKQQAEEYGYILVASNDSRNGLLPEITSAIYDAIARDVTRRVAIDTQRVYLMGFSGGARVAAYQGIYKKGIRGVIGCSAGLPANVNITGADFFYLGVVGTLDFNYLEMNQLFRQLEGSPLSHYLLTFEGTHAWPPAITIRDIFKIVQVEGMKNGLVKKDTAWLSAVFQELILRFSGYFKQKDWINTVETIRLAEFLFRDLPQEGMISALNKDLAQQQAYLLFQKQQNESLIKEKNLQQEFLQNLGSKDIKWWKDEIYRLNALIIQKKSSEESRVYMRLLSYLSLVCYMNATQMRATAHWDAFHYYVMVYALVDPENSETAYLQAVMEMHDNQPDKAIISLNKAVKLGFKDKLRMQSDTVFNSLKKDSRFTGLIDKMQ